MPRSAERGCVRSPDTCFPDTRRLAAFLGRATATLYNARGEHTATVFPDGNSVLMAYDAEGRKTNEVDQAGFETRYEYDPAGRLLRTLHPDGGVDETLYDDGDRPVVSVDALGKRTWFGYDPSCSCSARRTSVTNELGQVSRYAYDAAGNLTRFTDALGRETVFEYDDLNRRTRVIHPDGTSQQTVFDAAGRRSAQTDQAGKTTRYGYDPLGRLTAVTNALGHVTRYEYDELGRLTRQIDALNRATRYEHDALGRRTRRILPLGQVERLSYDAVGNLLTRADFNGRVTTYQYDALNRLLRKSPAPAFAAPDQVFTYDERGLRTGMTDASGATAFTYDEAGRLLTKTDANGVVTHAYDDAGNLLTTQSARPGGAAVTYEYDALNRLQHVVHPRLGLTRYTYNPVGSLESVLYPNLVSHGYQYDALNRLTSLGVNSLLTPIESYSYTLDPTGRRTRALELRGRDTRWEYDDLYRLTRETVLGASVSGVVDYTLDPVGNRLNRVSNLPGVAAAASSFDANDRLLGDTSDDNGNTLASEKGTDEYDFENRLLKRTKPDGTVVTLVYNADGDRMRKTVTATNGVSVVTRYLNDRNNPTGYSQVLEELDAAGNVLAVNTFGHDLIAREAGADVRYYVYDGHGSVRALTDAAGIETDRYDYDAFGLLIQRQALNPLTGLLEDVPVTFTGFPLASDSFTQQPYLYCGEFFDHDLGMVFLRARYLDPGRGRFWTMDEFEGFNTDPVSLHKYLYANGDGVNLADPSGQNAIALPYLAAASISITLGQAIVATTVVLYVWSLYNRSVIMYAGYLPGAMPHYYMYAATGYGNYQYDVGLEGGGREYLRLKKKVWEFGIGFIVKSPAGAPSGNIKQVGKLTNLGWKIWEVVTLLKPVVCENVEIPFAYNPYVHNCATWTVSASFTAFTLSLLPIP